MSAGIEPKQSAPPWISVDVAIVGAGLAGSAIAAILGRLGHTAGLIDLHAVCPAKFRAEQLVGAQVLGLTRLGLQDALTDLQPVSHAVFAQHGHVRGLVQVPHYGLRYDQLVSRLRSQVSGSASFIVGRVNSIQTSPRQQQLHLADGRRIDARLIVVATGLQQGLLRHIGQTRRVIREAHSISFGFDVVSLEDQGFPFPVLVYPGERLGDGIDYLTTFQMNGAARANLFAYRDGRDPWVQCFRRSPDETLNEVMPGLSRVLGRYRVVGPMQTRVTDLEQIDDPVRDGLVLIGDAYQTSCPAAGTGVGRLLNDVECLCSYLPQWLSSPGMAAEKIAQFYADPNKQAADKAAAHAAEYRRALATERSIGWALHRGLLQVRRRVGGLLGGPERLTTGLKPLSAILGANKTGRAIVPSAGHAQALGIVDPKEPALNG